MRMTCTSTLIHLWLMAHIAQTLPSPPHTSSIDQGATPKRAHSSDTGGTAPTDTTLSPRNTFETTLYSFDECKLRFGPDAESTIWKAYDDSWTMAYTEGVYRNIDWNGVIASDFLGAPLLDLAERSQIQAVFANLATVFWSRTELFPWYIKIRCDDPKQACPCGSPVGNDVLAYSMNEDPDEPAYPMINLCPGFFQQPTLSDAVSFGMNAPLPLQAELIRYDNQATTFQHELLHLNLAADSPSPNPFVEQVVYGPLWSKILARYYDQTDPHLAGYYVQRNADNLAYFALATYILYTYKLYPHLPIVTSESFVGAPHEPWTISSDYLASIVSQDGAVYLNITSGDKFSGPRCQNDTDDMDGTAEAALTITGFAPASAYTDEYNAALESWLSALADPSNSTVPDDNDGGSDSGSSGQQLALATYIYPGANVATWDRIIAMPSDKVSVIVANVVDGPDSTANAGWTNVIPRANASGKKVLGYVRTGYLGVSWQKFTTRLGSSKTSDWVAQIQEDVDQWYRLYPGQMGGIFFDEGWNDCGANDLNAKLYRFITQNTKRKYPGAYSVLNPGAPMPQCFEHSADTLLTAEISYATYTGSGYAPCDWTPSDPRKIWHIVYDVPIGQVAAVAALAKQRGVSMLHITDDIEPNPYDTVPNDAYMQQLMGAISGGTPPYEEAGPWADVLGPAIETWLPFMTAPFVDYSSATFVWTAASNAVGYRMLQDGVVVLVLTPDTTSVTVGGLQDSTHYVFGLAAINPDGTSPDVLDTVSFTTLSLPSGGHTVSGTSVSASANQAVYSAKILVPYAFVRLFIWNGNCEFVADAPVANDTGEIIVPDPINLGWPINFQPWYSICNQYMVEDGKLHIYDGSPDPTTGYMPWSWTYMAAVPVVQDGYDWTWTLPLGTADMKPQQFTVQVQGYGPRANVYNQCPQVPVGTNGLFGPRGITVEGDYCLG